MPVYSQLLVLWHTKLTIIGRNLWSQMKNDVLMWKRASTDLGLAKSDWLSKRDECEKKVAADAHTCKVLAWLAETGDPQPTLKGIKTRITPGGGEKKDGEDDNTKKEEENHDTKKRTPGRWFLDEEFADWCSLFLTVKIEENDNTNEEQNAAEIPKIVEGGATATDPVPLIGVVADGPPTPPDLGTENKVAEDGDAHQENAAEEQPQGPPKRAVWLQGTYGTGKTTLLYHALSILRAELPGFGTGRVIHYFCDATKVKGGKEEKELRPTCETILRSLVADLALLPNMSLSAAAAGKHGEIENPRYHKEKGEMDMAEWRTLFETILQENAAVKAFANTNSPEYNFVFVVDALDECKTDDEANQFLGFMKDIMTRYKNVYLLFSSHPQVEVRQWFDVEILKEVEVTPERTKDDLIEYVRSEIERREPKSTGSIFCEYKLRIKVTLGKSKFPLLIFE